MGLGKTMSMISLILDRKNKRREQAHADGDAFDEAERQYKKDATKRGYGSCLLGWGTVARYGSADYSVEIHCRLVSSHSTLVVAPASVIFQWEAEIERRVSGVFLIFFIDVLKV